MPSWIIRCSHCGRQIRVESISYTNECPACSNVLPPVDLSRLTLPKGKEEKAPLPVPEANKPVDQPEETASVVVPEMVDDDQGFDLGGVHLDDEDA